MRAKDQQSFIAIICWNGETGKESKKNLIIIVGIKTRCGTDVDMDPFLRVKHYVARLLSSTMCISVPKTSRIEGNTILSEVIGA